MRDSLLDDYAAFLRARGLAEQSVRCYLGQTRAFVAWYERERGPFRVDSVARLDVADYRRHLQDAGRKPATVNLVLVVLTSFFNWVVGEGLAPANPAVGVKRVPEQVPGPRWLDREAVRALLAAVSTHGPLRDRVLISVMLHTGLRVSEVCGLRPDDLELRDHTGRLRVRRGKGGKYREVPLNSAVRRVLQEYLASHPGGPWLFFSRQRTRLSVRSAERIVSRYARLAGLEGVTAHALRHTFCKMLVDAGESLDRVATLAGHANLTTTARYTRPSMTDLERAVGKLTWDL